MSYLLIFLGGGVGSALRHAVNRAALTLLGPGFPVGTLLVNVIGSAMMGIFASWLAARGEADQVRLFLTVGLLGGFTTFSAFSLDTVALWQRGEQGAALIYITASVGLSIIGLVLGLALARP
jgi:CrcB protein